MAREAATKALADAGLEIGAIEQAAVGYCSTGSTALFMAKQFIPGTGADPLPPSLTSLGVIEPRAEKGS